MTKSNASPPFGNRQSPSIVVSVVEARASDRTGNPWVSMPIDDQDLSQGYKEISFCQLNNYTNHAAQWLSENLPASVEPFQCFAYAGPKDLRYPILALAAAKLQKVVCANQIQAPNEHIIQLCWQYCLYEQTPM